MIKTVNENNVVLFVRFTSVFFFSKNAQQTVMFHLSGYESRANLKKLITSNDLSALY